ncbi:MAG: hypothetical protein J0L96_20120 [Anaerolineae bacterium]|nr:hypothetical protein [Anaerolineae bacterium]
MDKFYLAPNGLRLVPHASVGYPPCHADLAKPSNHKTQVVSSLSALLGRTDERKTY